MEVHPPHHPLHTWKDFWIHLATITVGLLIAISLEQSVEGLHHLHQRHQLEEDLHSDGERNVGIVEEDERYFSALRAWELDLRKDVDTMRSTGGKAGLPYRANPVPGQPTIPTDSAWMTAKESQLVALLPRAEAGMYGRLELQHQLLRNAADRWLNVKTELKAFEDNFDDAAPTSQPDLARMSGEELRAYSALLSKEVAVRDEVQFRLKNFVALDRAVLEGAQSEEEMLNRLQRDQAVVSSHNSSH
jgi:hypothetical protein